MPQYSVKVKWGKELFPKVVVNTDEEPMLFKAQIFAMTGVLPKRQKVMLNGMILKDDDWGNIKVKDGITVLMMGSKEEDVPVEPTETALFLEDMSESELATASNLPAGLVNLGNTCYLNATVQCLKSVPELREALNNFSGGLAAPGSSSLEPAQSITAALRDLYNSMDKGSSLPPIVLLQMMHLAFPRFAEKSDHGRFQQQDANECWTELMRMLQQKLPAKENPVTSEGSEQCYKPRSLIEQYFGGTFETELKCMECEDEPPTKGREDFLQLSCFISTDVIYMIGGIMDKMQEQITKKSPTLGRDAIYKKKSFISRLPAYLTIQFVRFYYKEKEAINAKILKQVMFPIKFDAFKLCSSELKKKLMPMRNKINKYEESREAKIHYVEKKLGIANKCQKFKQVPFSFEDDIGSNNSGYYSLQAVLTHKGRSSSSGHYVAWVRHTDNTWLKCDDDTVSTVHISDIVKTQGGSDCHCAYVLLYGPKILEIPEEEDDEEEDSVPK